MKATPLQPSLVNPIYMMAQGIGNNKKSLTLESEKIPNLIMQQNNLVQSQDDEDYDENNNTNRGSMPISQGEVSKSNKPFGGA